MYLQFNKSKGKNGKPIDSVSDLNGGLKLQGIAGLKQYLKTTKQDAFLHQMAQKNLGFALGRSLQYYDESVIRASVANLKKNDLRFSALVLTIVKSYPFRYRREKGHLTDAN